jgi:hypothetical protein
MGLFDGSNDPDQFEASGGLLGRLLSLQRQEGFLPHPDFDLPPSPAQPPMPSLMPWLATGSASPAQALQPHYEALRAAFAGNATPGAAGVQPGSTSLVRPLAGQQMQTQPAEPGPQSQPQQPATGAIQPGVNGTASGNIPGGSSSGGGIGDAGLDPSNPIWLPDGPALDGHSKAADIAGKIAYEMMHQVVTIPQRAIEASAADLQHLGDHSYTPQSIGRRSRRRSCLEVG